MEAGIWEIRTKLKNRIARVFVTKAPDKIVLLHGFIKKTQKTPATELEVARKRFQIIKKGK
jgi:phage-related protein